MTLQTKDWDSLFNKHASARRVCVDDFWRAFQEKRRRDALKDINAAAKQMKRAKLGDSEIEYPKWRHAGKNSLLDIPTDVPLEKLLYDATGKVHVRGDPWRCSKCGTSFLMGAPPDHCPVCRTPSFIANGTLNLRR